MIFLFFFAHQARQAHIIGLMRGGVLLAEESPAALMARRNVDSLETAFLQLSQLQESNIQKVKIKKTVGTENLQA